MQNYPKVVDILFDILTTFFYTLIFPIMILFYFLSPDKKFFVLATVIIAMETYFKKFMTIIYREPRPFMVDEYFAIRRCFCIFGNPSGHMSSTVGSYLIFLYYVILKRKIRFFIKLIFGLLFAAFAFFLGWSRMYFYSHFLN